MLMAASYILPPPFMAILLGTKNPEHGSGTSLQQSSHQTACQGTPGWMVTRLTPSSPQRQTLNPHLGTRRPHLHTHLPAKPPLKHTPRILRNQRRELSKPQLPAGTRNHKMRNITSAGMLQPDPGISRRGDG